jgi:hypothetical protein
VKTLSFKTKKVADEKPLKKLRPLELPRWLAASNNYDWNDEERGGTS